MVREIIADLVMYRKNKRYYIMLAKIAHHLLFIEDVTKQDMAGLNDNFWVALICY